MPRTAKTAHVGPGSPTVRRPAKPSGANQISSRAARQARLPRIYELRLAGASYPQIAAKERLNVKTVFEDYNEYLASIRHPPEEIAAQRDFEVQRLEAATLRIRTRLEKLTDEYARARYELTLLRIAQHKARLLGLEMPQEIHVDADVAVTDATTEMSGEQLKLIAVELARKYLREGSVEVKALPSGNGNGAHE